MPKKIAAEVKREAIRMRVEERLSIDEIQKRTGLSAGTLSMLLSNYPLNDEEIRERVSRTAIKTNMTRRYKPDKSKFAEMVKDEELSTDRKGQIAEAAVLYRLELLGYEVWSANSDGSRVDWLVSRAGFDKYIRLQVKWAKRTHWGKPSFALRNGENGKVRRLTRNDCDFVIGYDLETDTAFVVPIEVCEGKNAKSCEEKYAEAWHLLDI